LSRREINLENRRNVKRRHLLDYDCTNSQEGDEARDRKSDNRINGSLSRREINLENRRNVKRQHLLDIMIVLTVKKETRLVTEEVTTESMGAVEMNVRRPSTSTCTRIQHLVGLYRGANAFQGLERERDYTQLTGGLDRRA
jgi:hypothetical protein